MKCCWSGVGGVQTGYIQGTDRVHTGVQSGVQTGYLQATDRVQSGVLTGYRQDKDRIETCENSL